MPGKKRLFWQLYPSYLLITLISIVAVTWYASGAIRNFYIEQTSSDLEARAHLFEQQISEYIDPLNAKAIDQISKKAGAHALTRITVILPSGKVVGDSDEDPATMDNHADRPEFTEAIGGNRGTSLRHSITLEKDLMYVAILIKGGPHTAAIVRTSIPITSIDDALKIIQFKIMLGGLVMALFAAILSLFVSRRITRPIEQIRIWAKSIARGEFQPRPSVRATEEIEALCESLNRMAEDLRERISLMIRQRNEIEAMFSSMIEGVIALDMEEHVISMNQAASGILGCDLSAAKGRSIQEVVRNTALHEFIRAALEAHESIERDIQISFDGEALVNGRGTALRDAGGRQIGALIVLNDVTRLRRLENIRRDFVSNVSHEIKTPITAIKGFVETLGDGAVTNPEDAERFLGIIEKHVDRLEAIIEDLLNLSKIEQTSEREEIALVETRISEILQTVAQVCNVKAAAKRIKVEISCPESITAAVDPPLFEQAVVNLVDNAIKYSKEGESVRVEATPGDKEILIAVRDQGCGIEKKHLPRLFERFYRVDKARSRQLGGTGLGLAIVKHIVQAHGGTISVESIFGKGSTFTIRLPIA